MAVKIQLSQGPAAHSITKQMSLGSGSELEAKLLKLLEDRLLCELVEMRSTPKVRNAPKQREARLKAGSLRSHVNINTKVKAIHSLDKTRLLSYK